MLVGGSGAETVLPLQSLEFGVIQRGQRLENPLSPKKEEGKASPSCCGEDLKDAALKSRAVGAEPQPLAPCRIRPLLSPARALPRRSPQQRGPESQSSVFAVS